MQLPVNFQFVDYSELIDDLPDKKTVDSNDICTKWACLGFVFSSNVRCH